MIAMTKDRRLSRVAMSPIALIWMSFQIRTLPDFKSGQLKLDFREYLHVIIARNAARFGRAFNPASLKRHKPNLCKILQPVI